MQTPSPHTGPTPATSVRRFSVVGRVRSFGHALDGLGAMLRHEHNSRVHLAASVLVVAAGFGFGVSASDWRWLALAIGLVWIAEAFNTAIEAICDLVSPEFHPLVKRAKDVAAAAVLISALTAAVIGASVFWPYGAARVTALS